MSNRILHILFIYTFALVPSYGHVDTTWTGSLGIGHTSQTISSTGVPFKVTSAEVQLRKSAHTLVANISRKSLHGLTGNQLGLSYYRKWNWGYIHLGGTYSNDLIFPSLSLNTTSYFTVVKGLEVNLGFHLIQYATDVDLKILNIGTTYYYQSLMFSYQFRKPFSGFGSHRLTVRKYLKTEKDFVEVNLSGGLDIEGIDPVLNDPLKILGVQFSLFKKILHQTHLRVSFGVVHVENNTERKGRFNYGLGLTRSF